MTCRKKLDYVSWMFICFGIGVICLNLFENDIFMILSPFLVIPVWGCVALAFIVMLIGAVFYTIKRIKNGWRTWIPLAVLFLIVIMQFTIPYQKVYTDAEYFLNQPRREMIVKRILAGDLYHMETGFLKLLFWYRDLSKWQSYKIRGRSCRVIVSF